MNFPTELDGAKVVLITSNAASNNYGIVGMINDMNESIEETITGIAICQYEGSEEFYLFSCNLKWEVIGDRLYYTFEEARKIAREEFDVKDTDWHMFR